MDAKTILSKVSRLIEQQAQDDYTHTEEQKSAIMMESFAGLCAVAVLTHSDLTGMSSKEAYDLMCDRIEENVAEMILEEMEL